MGKGITGHEKPYRGKTNEWYTPRYITDALGDFDLDPCAGLYRSWDIATIVEDGLKQPWEGRVWLNPPYGEQTKTWLELMHCHRNGIVLIFARTETKMFHQHVWPVANGIFFFEGRIRFVDASGQQSLGSAGAPSCLISYDPAKSWSNHDKLRDCALRGKFVSVVQKPFQTLS